MSLGLKATFQMPRAVCFIIIALAHTSPNQIVIGAVDTPEARRDISKAVMEIAGTWWLDCGNNYHSGQIILGNGRKKNIN